MNESTDPNRLVRLRNGDEGPFSAVSTITLVLRRMMTADGIPGVLQAYDLRQWCREPASVSATRQQEFKDMGFGGGSDGGAHELVKSVVVSALVGEGLSMHLQSPIEPVSV